MPGRGAAAPNGAGVFFSFLQLAWAASHNAQRRMASFGIGLLIASVLTDTREIDSSLLQRARRGGMKHRKIQSIEHDSYIERRSPAG
jgi:hypothetical protein